MTSRCPRAFKLATVGCICQTSNLFESQINDAQSGHFVSSFQPKEGTEEVWHEPCLCQRYLQLPGIQIHNLHSCSPGTDDISGERG